MATGATAYIDVTLERAKGCAILGASVHTRVCSAGMALLAVASG